MPKLMIDDVEYGTFDDVLKIEDPVAKQEAVKEWAQAEHAEKKNPQKDEDKEDEDKESNKEDVEEKEETENEEDSDSEESNEDKPSDTAPEKDTSDEDDSTPEKETADKETDDDNAPEKDTEDSEVDQEERIKAYAERHDIKVEDAIQAIEKIDNIKKKFNGDVDEIAYSAYSAQKAHSQMKEHARRAQLASQSPFEWREDSMIFHGKREDGSSFDEKYTQDQIVEKFRGTHKDDTEKLDDEAVFALAKLDNKQWFENQVKSQESAVVSQAEKKTDVFFKNLPEKDKRFEKDVREAVKSLSHYDIVDNEHSLFALLNIVKGAKLDDIEKKHAKDLKDAEKKGFERGQKNSVILGEEEKKADTKGGENKSKGTQYGAEFKRKALDKFANFRITDDEKFKLYEDIDALEKKRRN